MTSKLFSDPAVPQPGPRSLAALLTSAALLFAACSADEQKPLDRPSITAPTAVVQNATIPSTRTVAGTVVSTNVAPLAAKVVGNVLRVLVSEGDRVRAGQLLVEIDAREAVAQTDRARAGSAEIERAIEAAQANAGLAETTLKRYTALFERHSVSAQEYDDVKARNSAAQAELARLVAKRGEARAMSSQAQTFLDYSFVRSPIDGVVTRRFVDPGAQAAPGMPLVAVEDSKSYRVEATVPEGLGIAPGDAVGVEIGGTVAEGRVSHVQPDVDAASRSTLVKITVPQAAGLRSGAYVRVHVPTGRRQAITVPESAIVRRGQLTSVFVVGDDGVARMRLITLGEGGEVLSGLDEGDRVVTEPAKVTDGAKIV